MPDPVFKPRLRLWLRSEKALGVPALRRPEKAAMAPVSSGDRETPVEPPGFAVVTAPRPAAAPAEIAPTATSELFGGDDNTPAMPDPNASSFEAEPLSLEERVLRLRVMDETEVSPCTRCPLHSTRTHTVFGEGDPEAKIFFIGEGPGETEDQTGRPFVGRAGQLLDKMIAGMGLERGQVFIANIVKCRPPNNRVPAADEVATCTPYLERQLEIVRPRVIVTLGLPATQYMLQTRLSMGKLRGQFQRWRGIKLMPTYHPAFLLRAYTEDNRKAVWSDLKAVMAEIGLPQPSRKS